MDELRVVGMDEQRVAMTAGLMAGLRAALMGG
jgi:hypothetical protein